MSNNLPALKNTWGFDVNNVAGTSVSALDSYQKTIFTVKETLISLISNPWTVHSSSDSTVATLGDTWGASTDCVWATPPTAHSWIVLEP